MNKFHINDSEKNNKLVLGLEVHTGRKRQEH
jgi:hypothetical protein